MKINQIIVQESMGGVTAGAIATVESPLGGVKKRTSVQGLEPVSKVISGKTKKKGPYANSLSEGKMKDLSMDLRAGKDGLNDADFKKKYGKTKEEMRKSMSKKPEPVKEAKLDEDDIIVVPGQKMKRKTGFVQHGQSRVDHEVEMARSDVLATMKNAKAIYELLRNRSEDEGIEGWVQEKLIKANDYLNAVKEYYDEKMMQEMTGGVIAAGGVGEAADMSPELLSTMNQKHKDFYKKNPHFAQGKQHTLVDKGAMATKVEPSSKPAQVKKKPMTPFGQQKVDEKAVSKAQQRFMGMAHAIQKGKKIPGASKELKAVAKGMSKKAGHDFASTKHKGLPEKVKKD